MSLVKNDSKMTVIFALAIALLCVTLGWPIAVAFACGWMIRNFMWVRMINKELPAMIKAASLKMLADGIKKSKLN